MRERVIVKLLLNNRKAMRLKDFGKVVPWARPFSFKCALAGYSFSTANGQRVSVRPPNNMLIVGVSDITYGNESRGIYTGVPIQVRWPEVVPTQSPWGYYSLPDCSLFGFPLPAMSEIVQLPTGTVNVRGNLMLISQENRKEYMEKTKKVCQETFLFTLPGVTTSTVVNVQAKFKGKVRILAFGVVTAFSFVRIQNYSQSVLEVTTDYVGGTVTREDFFTGVNIANWLFSDIEGTEFNFKVQNVSGSNIRGTFVFEELE